VYETHIYERLNRMKGIQKIGLLWTLGSMLWAQGDALLLQQYRLGPDLDAFYHNWNFEIQGNIYNLHPDVDYTESRWSFGLGLGAEKRFSKTFGVSLSAQWHTVHYRYSLSQNKTKDRVNYLVLPFTGRAHATRRLFFEAGPSVAIPLQATNENAVRTTAPVNQYNSGVFKINPGMYVGISYNPWWRLHLKAIYQLWRRKADPLQYQPNRFRGFSFQIHYFLKNPRKKPTP